MILVDGLYRAIAPDPSRVQALRHHRRNKGRWCHLGCDAADDPEDLHVLAQEIGLKRAWFQDKNQRLPHYDLTPGMRSRAVKAGAVEVTAQEFVKRIVRAGTRP